MDYKQYSEDMMKGTTTIGIICADGVVMGADSRATAGTFIASSEAIKVYRISDNLGMTIAGGVGDAEYLVKILKVQHELYRMGEGKPMSPSSATSLLSLILQENKMFPFMVELVVGGINQGSPELYSLDPFGGYIKESNFYSTGSGSLTALGYLEGIYAKGMSTQDAARHVAKSLQIAMKRDSATGDTMKIVAISKKGFREYTKEEIEKLLK